MILYNIYLNKNTTHFGLYWVIIGPYPSHPIISNIIWKDHMIYVIGH